MIMSYMVYDMNIGYKFNKSFESRFQVYLSAPQLIPNNVLTRINFDVVQYDPLDEYDEAVLYQFQPNQAGYYSLNAGLIYSASIGGSIYNIQLRINGIMVWIQIKAMIAGVLPELYISRFYYLLPTDVVWIDTTQITGAGLNLTPAIQATWFEGFRTG